MAMVYLIMKRTFFILVFIVAYFYNCGCSAGTRLSAVKMIGNMPTQEVDRTESLPSTTKYVLKINPSLFETGVRVGRVEVELSYQDKDDVDTLYMKPMKTDGKSFVVEVPRRSTAKFSVWLNPNKDPDGGSYCGPVRLYSDGLVAEQTGRLREEEVLQITITSDSSTPRYCIYRRLSYHDL